MTGIDHVVLFVNDNSVTVWSFATKRTRCIRGGIDPFLCVVDELRPLWHTVKRYIPWRRPVLEAELAILLTAILLRIQPIEKVINPASSRPGEV
jgi:hypothetical protein